MDQLSHFERHALAVEKLPNGETSGRDPRKIPLVVMQKIGHYPAPLLKVIRAKCLDCSHVPSEVFRCTAYSCPLWPYRMGKNPMRSDERKEADAAKAEKMRSARKDEHVLA